MTLKVSSTPTWLVGEDKNQSGQNLVVSSTTNYDKFRLDLINRPVDRKHVEELIVAIKAKNLLREYPIVVDTDYTVLDGQHRLLTAQFLRVPIFFIVSKDMKVNDVASANKHQAEWNTEDYLHHWRNTGNPHYIALQEFRNTYPFLSVSICRFLLSGNIQRSDGLFDSGGFTINRPELAEKVAKCLIDFRKYTPLYIRFQFVNAVASMVAHPEYNHKRMLQKLDYMSGHVHRCVDAAEYLAMLSDIYNFKAKEDIKLKFTSIAKRGSKTATKE